MKTKKFWTFWVILSLLCTQSVLAAAIDVCPMMNDSTPAELTAPTDHNVEHGGMIMQSDSQTSFQNCCDDTMDSDECMTMGCAMVSIPVMAYQFYHNSQYHPQFTYLLNSPPLLSSVFFRPPIV